MNFKEKSVSLLQIFFLLNFSTSSVFGPNFKVIYLNRDPRGSINSLLQSPELSSNRKFVNVTHTCDRLYRDSQVIKEVLGNNLLKHRLKVVNYEDLIEHPKYLSKILYLFLGADNFLSHAYEYIDEHQLNSKNLHHYYSDLGKETHLKLSQSISKNILSKYFGPNSWKDELPKEYLNKINTESSCVTSMKIFGYL